MVLFVIFAVIQMSIGNNVALYSMVALPEKEILLIVTQLVLKNL